MAVAQSPTRNHDVRVNQHRLAHFGFNDLMECRAQLRSMIGVDYPTQEVAAQGVVRYFYENLLDDEGQPACALVRLFKTNLFDALPDELKAFARKIAPDADKIRELRCLVLMATAGRLPAWNSRHESTGHKAIPLVSEQMVEQAPMIAQLVRQFGLKLSTVVRPEASLLLDADGSTFNVFHVPEAIDSPYIPSQDFVRKHGVRSVLGTGGMGANGDMFALILFSRVPVSVEVADHFKVVGLNLRMALLPSLRKPLF
jgi:hypothetical protein